MASVPGAVSADGAMKQDGIIVGVDDRLHLLPELFPVGRVVKAEIGIGVRRARDMNIVDVCPKRRTYSGAALPARAEVEIGLYSQPFEGINTFLRDVVEQSGTVEFAVSDALAAFADLAAEVARVGDALNVEQTRGVFGAESKDVRTPFPVRAHRPDLPIIAGAGEQVADRKGILCGDVLLRGAEGWVGGEIYRKACRAFRLPFENDGIVFIGVAGVRPLFGIALAIVCKIVADGIIQKSDFAAVRRRDADDLVGYVLRGE